MIKQAIEKVVNHENLTFEESEAVLDEIMNGEASLYRLAQIRSRVAPFKKAAKII